MTSKFYLPSKIISYLKRLQLEYDRSGDSRFTEIIQAARVFVREGSAYDNWNGGTYGHDVLLFLPVSVLGNIELANQAEYSKSISSDLNKCAQSVDTEFFNTVSFELEDENDPEFQQSFSVSARPEVNPDTLSIWKPGQIRLFISHRDAYKEVAKQLASALEGYGISAFVAHDTIEPMATWQNEILKGLETMEVMLAFLTDDFHESTWVNQELGFALGRNIPIIPLKLQKSDPKGFINTIQALRGNLDNPGVSAANIYKVLAEKLGNRDRLQTALVTAFIQSPNFDETKIRFDRLNDVVDSLSAEEVARIVRGFEENNQLHGAGHLTSKYHRLRNFLNRTTKKKYTIHGNTISVEEKKVTDEIPF